MIASTAVALGLALAVGVQAQDTTVKSKTRVKGGDVKMVTYSGCVRTGTETETYVLEKAVPVSRTTQVGTSGEVTSTTTYALVPGETVQLQRQVGHKVEVTGMLIPAGRAKTESRTKIERKGAKDVEIKEEAKSEHALPQFKVTSVKQLAESCS